MMVTIMDLAMKLPQYTIEELWEKPIPTINAWASAIQVLVGDEHANLRLTKEDKEAIEFLEKNRETMTNLWSDQ